MPREKSAGAVVFRMEGGEPLYLLLRYPGGGKAKRAYWDFPKGHVEQDENEEQTVRREVKEETGVRDLFFIHGFRQAIDYFFQKKGSKIFKVVVFYLARTKSKEVKVSFEHIGYQWASFGDSMRQLKFGNAKQILTKAHNFLRGKGFAAGSGNTQRERAHVQSSGFVGGPAKGVQGRGEHPQQK